MKRRSAFMIAITVAVVLSACSNDAKQVLAEIAQGGGLPVLVTAKEPQDAYLSNLRRGLLSVDSNGCLRHGTAFVIWPHGSQIERTAEGQLRVIDGATGKTVLVGQEIGMSGVANNELPDGAHVALPIPTQCGGPYMWGGPVVTNTELQAS